MSRLLPPLQVIGTNGHRKIKSSKRVIFFQGVSLEHLSEQGRFPDKLPENGVSWKARLLQDYDPDPHAMHHYNQRERNRAFFVRISCSGDEHAD